MATISASDLIVSSWVNSASNNFNGKEVIKYYIHDSQGYEYDLNSNANSWTYTYEHYTGEENYIDYVFSSIDPYISLDFEKAYSASEGDIDIYMLGNWSPPSSLGFTSISNNKTEVFWYATNQYYQIGYWPLQDDDAFTLVHEIGHALGLSHPQLNGADDPYGSWHDSDDTVMSYNYNASATAPIWKTIDIQALIDIWGSEGGDTTAPLITGPSGSAGDSESITIINENTTTVHTFTANETVTWSIDGGLDPTFFSINSSTGLLTFKDAPDYENPLDSNANGMYSIYVKATDNSGNSSKQFVYVDVADVVIESDTEKPIIYGVNGTTMPSSALYMDENKSYINTFVASEKVTWSLPSSYAVNSLFKIDPISGVLSFNQAPDYENPPSLSSKDGSRITFLPVVRATDAAGNFTQQSIYLLVEDVIDEKTTTSLAATSTDLQQLYIGYFGRPCDPEGLDYWLGTEITTKAFAANMYLQPEFNSVNGNLNTRDQVNQIYLNLFNRNGDSEGLDYWTENINTGKLELASIANDLVWAALNNAGSNVDKKTLNHKTNAAILYTYEIKSSSSSKLAYQPVSTSPWVTGSNLNEAKAFINTIDDSSVATLTDIQTSIGKFSSTSNRFKLDDNKNHYSSIDQIIGLAIDTLSGEFTGNPRQHKIATDSKPFSSELLQLNDMFSDHLSSLNQQNKYYNDFQYRKSNIEDLNFWMVQSENHLNVKDIAIFDSSLSTENGLLINGITSLI